MIDIKRAVSDKRSVTFQFYKNGELWYITEFGETFPVPTKEAGSATFPAIDKAMLYMRFMRKWNEANA